LHELGHAARAERPLDVFVQCGVDVFPRRRRGQEALRERLREDVVGVVRGAVSEDRERGANDVALR